MFTDSPYEIEGEARGELFAVALVPLQFNRHPLYGFRCSIGDRRPFPGSPARGGIIFGTAGRANAEELATALEAAAAKLRKLARSES